MGENARAPLKNQLSVLHCVKYCMYLCPYCCYGQSSSPSLQEKREGKVVGGVSANMCVYNVYTYVWLILYICITLKNHVQKFLEYWENYTAELPTSEQQIEESQEESSSLLEEAKNVKPHTHTHTRARAHTHAHSHTRALAHTHTCERKSICMHTCKHTCTHANIPTHINTRTCTHTTIPTFPLFCQNAREQSDPKLFF